MPLTGFSQSGNTYTLDNNFTTNGWTIQNIIQIDPAVETIIDGNNKIVTINDADFNGLFYAGNTGANTLKPTIIKNFKIKSTVNINVALAKITGSVSFENCHLELFGANINSNGGGLAYNSTGASGLKVTFTNCSAKVFGKIGENAGPLIGYVGSNSGNEYTITNCKIIVSDNNSENGTKTLGSGAGAFVGSGISNTVTINTSYCLFNGSMAYGSGIIGGKFLGSSGTLTINKFYAVTNISSITSGTAGDVSQSAYLLSSYHGGSGPNTFALSNVYILNLKTALENVYSSGSTIESTLTGLNKYTTYTDFNTAAHASTSTKIGTDTFAIDISGTNQTFYSYTDSNKNNFKINSVENSLKIKPTITPGYAPVLNVNTSAYVPPTLPETNSNGLIYFKSSDNTKLKTSRGIVTSITEPPFAESLETTFSIKFKGYFKTSTAGTWTFLLNSDDSSQLYIDGTKIIDFSGVHSTSAQPRSGTIAINANQFYFVELYYGQNTGNSELSLSIKNPSNAVVNIDSVMFTDKTSDAINGLSYEYYDGYYNDVLSFFNTTSDIYFKTPSSGTVTGLIIYTSETNEFTSSKATVNVTINANTGTSITIKARNRTITFGDSLGASQWDITTGTLSGSDSITNLTITFNGISANLNRIPVGTYTNLLIPSNAIGTGLTNYNITYAPGTLTVQQKTQTITINAPKQIYKAAGYTKSAILYSTTLTSPDTIKSIDYKFAGSTTVPVAVGSYAITLADNYPTINYNKNIPYLDSACTIQFATPLFLLNPSDFKTVINGQTVNLTVDTVLADSNFVGTPWSDFKPKTEGTNTILAKNQICPKYFNVGGYLNNPYIGFNAMSGYKNYIQKLTNSTPISLQTNRGFTAFFLVNLQNNTVGEALIEFYESSTKNRLFIGRDATLAGKLYVSLYCGTTQVINKVSTNNFFVTGSWNIIGVRITYIDSSSFSLDMYNVNTPETFTITGTLTDITPTTLNIFKTSSTKYTVGKLGNIFIFNSSLSNYQIDIIVDYLKCINSNYNYSLVNPDNQNTVNAEIINATPILTITQSPESDFIEYVPSTGGFLGFGQASKTSNFTLTFGFSHSNLSVELVDEPNQTNAPTKTVPTFNAQNLTGSIVITSYHPGLVKVNLSSYADDNFPQDLQATALVYFKPKKPTNVSVTKFPNDGSYVAINIKNEYAKTTGVGNYNVSIAYKISTSNSSFPADYIILTGDQVIKEMDDNLGQYSGKYIFYINSVLNNGNPVKLSYDTTYYIKFNLIINGASSVESDIFSFTTSFAGTNFENSVEIDGVKYTMDPSAFTGDFSSKDLTGAILGGGDISNVIISNGNGITMNGRIILKNAIVTNLTSINAKYNQFDMYECTISNSNFTNSTFEYSEIDTITFENCNFSQLKLEKFSGNSDFVLNRFNNINFIKCNLVDSVLYGSTFEKINMDLTTDPTDIKTDATMKYSSGQIFPYKYFTLEETIGYRKGQTIEEQNELSKSILDSQLGKMNLSSSLIPQPRGSVVIPQNSEINGSCKAAVFTTGAVNNLDTNKLAEIAALIGQSDAVSDLAEMSGAISGFRNDRVYVMVAMGPKQQPQLYPPSYQSLSTSARAFNPIDFSQASFVPAQEITPEARAFEFNDSYEARTAPAPVLTPGEKYDRFIAEYIDYTYALNGTNGRTRGVRKVADFLPYSLVNNFPWAKENDILEIWYGGDNVKSYHIIHHIKISSDVNGNLKVTHSAQTETRQDPSNNANVQYKIPIQCNTMNVVIGVPTGITFNTGPTDDQATQAERIEVSASFPTSIELLADDIDLETFVTEKQNFTGVKSSLNYNVIGQAASLESSLSKLLKITQTGQITVNFTLPPTLLFKEQKISKTLTISKPTIASKNNIDATLKAKLTRVRRNAGIYTGNVSIGKFSIQRSGILSQDLEADTYINDFNSPTEITIKSNVTFAAPAQTVVMTAVVDATSDAVAYNTFKTRFEKNGRVIKEIIKFVTDSQSGNIKYTSANSNVYLAGHVNSTEDDFTEVVTPTITQVGQNKTYDFQTNGFSYWIIFESNSTNDVRQFRDSVLAVMKSGGDPIIHPLIGPKYSLAPHIKFVNLLADYSTNIFINAHVDMMKPSDFPKQIYWDKSFSNTDELSHIYSNSYYRRFFVYYAGEAVEIDADTLEVNKLTKLNKIKVASFKPKTGIKSISFDKTYPLTNATKAIKIGFGNFILTLTSDINTDDRHHLELFNVKNYSLIHMSGALISKDQILRISNLAGPELFEYKSNPFLITKPNE